MGGAIEQYKIYCIIRIVELQLQSVSMVKRSLMTNPGH